MTFTEGQTKVIEALNLGHHTSLDIANITKLPRKQVFFVLRMLKKWKYAEPGPHYTRVNKRGPKLTQWFLTEEYYKCHEMKK